jgi:DNA-binding Xre family transcriptional regulator
MQRKIRLEVRMMRLGLDELTINKLDNMELREITGITRSNINSRIQI